MGTYSGFTEETTKHLLLDAGAFFKNFDIETDTYESALVSGKLIGATKDGGEFQAKPELRQIQVDGVKGAAMGLDVVDSWNVYIKANVLEIKKETIVSALCTASVDTESKEDYDIITAKNEISLSDYIDNITWIGTLSGTEKPVIIQVENTIDTEGLTLATKDKDQAVITMTFEGRYSMKNLDRPPFKILYPKNPAAANEPGTVNESDTY